MRKIRLNKKGKGNSNLKEWFGFRKQHHKPKHSDKGRFIPYAMRFYKQFRNRSQYPTTEPKRGHYSQLVVNMDLMNRARFALQNGVYPPLST